MRTLIFSFIVSGLTSIMVVNATAQNVNQVGGRTVRMYRGLEDAAAKATGLDRNSVSNLVDEVFKYPTLAQLPAALTPSLKNRFVDAEVAHRQGRGPGITDEKLAQVFNDAVKKLGFPDYALTSAGQIRFLRTRLSIRMPTFLGTVRPAAKVGDPIDDVISPAQAAHLMVIMADQKLMNPFWQVSPEEWDPTKFQLPSGTLPGKGQAPMPQLKVSAGANPKANEMRAIAAQSMGNMTTADAVDFVNQSLAKLGL